MHSDEISPRERLIVALDVPSPEEARALVAQIGDAASFYKVGLELVLAGGLDLVRELHASGNRVFLDMKLLDIANTVERAVAAAAKTGATCLTVHATDTQTLKAAVAGRGDTSLKLLGVTVLTNLSSDDLIEQGVTRSPLDVVAHRARLIAQIGIDGVVASGHEAAHVRQAVGPDTLIVTPGIRRKSDQAGDQARVTTPEMAIGSGADYVVVGRPISRATDPKAAAEGVVAEIATAVASKPLAVS